MTQEDTIKIQRLMLLVAPMDFSLVTTRETPDGYIIVTLRTKSSTLEEREKAAAAAAE